jgi:hypothetical protein
MPPEFWELLKSYGVAALPLAILAVGYFSERGDRKAAEKELKDLYKWVFTSSQQRVVVDQVGNQVAAAMANSIASAVETMKQPKPEGA